MHTALLLRQRVPVQRLSALARTAPLRLYSNEPPRESQIPTGRPSPVQSPVMSPHTHSAQGDAGQGIPHNAPASSIPHATTTNARHGPAANQVNTGGAVGSGQAPYVKQSQSGTTIHPAGYANNPASGQGQGLGTQPPSMTPAGGGGGPNKGLIAILILAGLGGAYYYSQDDPEAAALRDFHKAEAEGAHLYEKAKSKIQHELPSSNKGESIGKKLNVATKGSRVDPYTGPVVESAHELKEGALESSWLDVFGRGPSSGKFSGEVKDTYDSAKADMKQAGRDVKEEGKGWFNWGEKKADEVSAKARAGVNDVERESSSLYDRASSQASAAKAQAAHNLDQVKNKASAVTEQARIDAEKFKDRISSSVSSGQSEVERDARELKQEVKETGSSWFNWGSKKADEAKSSTKQAAHDAKLESERLTNKAGREVDQAAEKVASDAKWLQNETGKEINKASDKIGEVASDLKQGGKEWASYASDKASAAAGSVSNVASDIRGGARRLESDASSAIEREKRDASSALSDVSNRTQAEIERERQWASDKANDVKGDIRRSTEAVKEEGKSWWSWGGKKADEAIEEGQRLPHQLKENVEAAGYNTKEALKSGLLKAEEATERGAQKAQQETKKL